MNKKITALLVASSLVAVAGCTKKEKPQDLPPPPATPEAPAPVNTGPAPGSQADFVASISSDRIFFDTDKFDVDSEDQAILSSQAQWLQRYPNVRVTIEGHADERGTRDYNIALGARRANAAKNALAALGIDAARISTVSYGKERPDALGSTEADWARNRRAVTVTIQ
ncbi:MAG: peptidoglycan-associated lipoprotein Pal [Chakrabartia sp.]